MSGSIAIINQQTIREELDYKFAAELIHQGFAETITGKINSPARHAYRGMDGAPILGFMPAVGDKYMSVKVAAVQYTNPAAVGLDSHQGAVLLFAKQTGALLSVIDASELTAIRTTAVSQVALQVLGGGNIKKVAVIGAGAQAYHHVRMLREQINAPQFVIVSRSSARVAELRDALKEVEIEHRVYGADLRDCSLIVCATHGEETVLYRDQVARDALIFALGACHAKARELDDSLLDSSDFIVDSFTSLSGSGESIFRTKHPKYGEISELAEFLAKPRSPERTRPLIFKAVGLGFEDLVCGVGLYERAIALNLGTRVNNFGGARAY